MIEMNRISALLHKMNFFARQRRAVKYTHKFVITAKDTKKQGNQQVSNDKDPITNATKVLEGFDPVNNVVDRRLLFEVTGMRLHSDEFQDGESSESDQGDELLPIDYAFMERFDNQEDDDDDTGQKENLTTTLNP